MEQEQGIPDQIIRKYLDMEEEEDNEEEEEDNRMNIEQYKDLNDIQKQSQQTYTGPMDLALPDAHLKESGQALQQQKDEKKKKKPKRKKKEDDPPTDWEGDFDTKVKNSKLLECKEIPEHVRFKYAHIESNPYNMIISNIPPSATQEEMREYFNTLIVSLDPSLYNPPPVKNVEIGMTKTFSVITFSQRPARDLVKKFKELEYMGFKMQIKKPLVFFRRMTARSIWSDDPYKERDNSIYLGGLPLYLNDENVRKLCETFGELKSFNLVKENTGASLQSKGYCFFEYQDPAVTDKAVKGLNNLPCGDKKLKVNRASHGQQQIREAQLGGRGRDKKQPSNFHGSFLAGCDLIHKQSIQEMLNLPKFTTIPSRIVQFLNMVSAEDLFEDELFQDLYDDVKEECQAFGHIEQIIIPKPDFHTGIASPQVGKVFVKFKYIIPAKKARHALSGRTYNKRIVFASFYPEERFEMKEFLVNY